MVRCGASRMLGSLRPTASPSDGTGVGFGGYVALRMHLISDDRANRATFVAVVVTAHMNYVRVEI